MGISRRWLSAATVLMLLVTGIFAQDQQEYQPQVGQPGKDVVWVPTQQDLVDRMLKMAKVTPQDFVIDLGSGDGRTVITAAKLGAKALGIEYNHDMVELSKKNAASAGVNGKAEFIEADLFQSDFSKASVITMFLLPDINLRLRPRLLDLKPGTRIVSNSFDMGEWEADDTIRSDESCTTWCTAYLWIVPAKVEGKWRLPDGELTLKQEFQKISGTLVSGNKSIPVAGTLKGEQISFTAGDAEYTGQVNDDRISGTMKSEASSTSWHAEK